MININNLNVTRRKIKIFNELDFEFTDIGLYKINAPNGYGKTTILNLIYNSCPQIDITINNKLAKNIKQDVVSFASQKPILFEDMTVLENIKVLAIKTTKDELNDFGIKNLLSKKVAKLSGGEKQRVNLYINLFKKANIYLIDEPFNNLDKDYLAIVGSKILSLSKSSCVIMISHTHKFESQIEVRIENEKLVKMQQVESTKVKLPKFNNKFRFSNMMYIRKNTKPIAMITGFLVICLGILNLTFAQNYSSYAQNTARFGNMDQNVINVRGYSNTMGDVPAEDLEDFLINMRFSFSQEDVESIKALSHVTDVIYSEKVTTGSMQTLSANNNTATQIITPDQLDYSIYSDQAFKNNNNSYFAKADSITTSFLSMGQSKELLDDFPGYFTEGKLVYGDFPTNANELLIDENLALQIATENNYSSIEEVIGKKTKIESTCEVGGCGVDDFTVVGIYHTYEEEGISDIFYATDLTGEYEFQKQNLASPETSAYNYSEFQIIAPDDMINTYSYDEFLSKNKSGFESKELLVVVDDVKNIENVMLDLEQLFKYNQIESPSVMTEYSLISAQLIVMSLVTFVLMILFMCFTLNSFIKDYFVFKFYGFSRKEIGIKFSICIAIVFVISTTALLLVNNLILGLPVLSQVIFIVIGLCCTLIATIIAIMVRSLAHARNKKV